MRKVSASGTISRFAGTGTCGYTGDNGPAVNAELSDADGVAVDASGNVYIGDSTNNVVRKVSPAGIISTFAGTGTLGYTGDNGPATSAELSYPWGVRVDRYAGAVFSSRDADKYAALFTADAVQVDPYPLPATAPAATREIMVRPRQPSSTSRQECGSTRRATF